MKFQLKPILSEIKELYSKPISNNRFEEYISKLQGGTKGDMALPISGFNPMAKDHILKKITELENLEAEKLIEEAITEFNASINGETGEVFLVVLNIADDLKGAWTNYYSTDFDSKFKLNAFINRKFCAPYFWTSETYTSELIKLRTKEYLGRTLYRSMHPQTKTLEEHFNQEIYAAARAGPQNSTSDKTNFENIEKFYLENKTLEDYDVIFNFFFGDKGSDSLGYKKFGNTYPLGFEYARLIS